MFIHEYVQKILAQIQDLHIFSDGCIGKNRINIVIRYLLALPQSDFVKLIIAFQSVTSPSRHVTKISAYCRRNNPRLKSYTIFSFLLIASSSIAAGLSKRVKMSKNKRPIKEIVAYEISSNEKKTVHYEDSF